MLLLSFRALWLPIFNVFNVLLVSRNLQKYLMTSSLKLFLWISRFVRYCLARFGEPFVDFGVSALKRGIMPRLEMLLPYILRSMIAPMWVAPEFLFTCDCNIFAIPAAPSSPIWLKATLSDLKEVFSLRLSAKSCIPFGPRLFFETSRCLSAPFGSF